MSPNAAISAGHQLAADTARDVLAVGGATVDAAIAAAAVQCVVEMPWCGLGGDTFALVHDGKRTTSLNGSGCAPAGVRAALGERSSVPRFGALSVGVPGTVSAWFELHARFGRTPMAELLEPAAYYARRGVRDERLARAVHEHAETLAGWDIDFDGLLLVQPALAATIDEVRQGGCAAFYHGDIAERIASAVGAEGGALSRADLAAHESQWADPLSVSFRGARVHSQVPVSMGVLFLAALRLFERRYQHYDYSELDAIDAMVAIKKAVFGRIFPQLGDPRLVTNPDVLSDIYLAAIEDTEECSLLPMGADTTTLAIAGPDGMTVSLIHSLFNEFGARVMVPGTGVVLNDRLANLKAGQGPNALLGGRRPMHTLHTYVVERTDGVVIAGATPGGRGQVQTNLQVLANVFDRGDDLQTAIDRPRWVHGMPRVSPTDDTLYLESGLAAHADALRARGHRIELLAGDHDDHFGSCTVVARGAGMLAAAADRRRSAASILIEESE